MINLIIEPCNSSAIPPRRTTTHAACFDVYANVLNQDVKARCTSNDEYVIAHPVDVYPGHKVMVSTGYKMQAPAGYKLVIYPRSGLAWKNGVTLANSVGVVDSDYTNPVMVLLHNTSGKVFRVNEGDRIAQIALEKVIDTTIVLVETLPEVNSNRTGGFGSTGLI